MKNIKFQNIELTQKRFGSHNTHLGKISSAFNVTLNSRGNAISLAGQDKNLAAGKKTRLIEVKKLLGRIKRINFVTFTKEDVVRYTPCFQHYRCI